MMDAHQQRLVALIAMLQAGQIQACMHRSHQCKEWIRGNAKIFRATVQLADEYGIELPTLEFARDAVTEYEAAAAEPHKMH